MNSSLRAFRISQKNYVGYWLVLCRQKDRLCMWQGNKASICQLPNWNQQWIGYLQHCYFYRHDASILYSCIMDGRINSRYAVAQHILSLYYLITIRKSKIETPLTGKVISCPHSLKTADLENYTIVFIIKVILGCIAPRYRIVVMNTHTKEIKIVTMFLFITQSLWDMFDILVLTEVNWTFVPYLLWYSSSRSQFLNFTLSKRSLKTKLSIGMTVKQHFTQYRV